MRRNKNELRYVGLIMEDIFTEFAKEVIRGVVNAAREQENIRLVLLVGRQNENKNVGEKQYIYKTVYNTIYHLEESCKFDGLILTLPNMWAVEKDSFGLERVSNYSKIPKVFVATRKENETTVNYDNEAGIRETIDYLVNSCGVRRICMLGGRTDNMDAMERKRIFKKCLEDNQIPYDESMYETADMSTGCTAEASRLLDRNPNTQAVFCVNDPTAVALYAELERRDLVPGKDVYVFGFDNTLASSSMVPPLASIGPKDETLGKRALETLLEKMDGKQVESVMLDTRLYGRASCPYDRYEYTIRELLNVDEAFIYRMFDDCFYRYKNEYFDSKDINLKRLFYEFISRMLYSMKRRYLSTEEFEEIGRLIDIFYDNGAMDYTDATKFLQCVERLQSAMNFLQKSVSTSNMNNRLFTRMKDRAILSLSSQWNKNASHVNAGRGVMQDFQIETTDFDRSGSNSVENIIRHFDKLGPKNAALYLYDEPVDFNPKGVTVFPDHLNLRCVTKAGTLYVIPPERQYCTIENIFQKKEIPTKCLGYVPFPVFFGSRIYGLMVCELTQDIPERGEYIVSMLSRVLYLNDMEVINSPAETEQMKRARQDKKKQEIFGQIAEGLASHYDIIYYVNSVSANYMEFKANNIYGNLVVQEEGRNFFEETRSNARKLVHSEDRDRIVTILSRDHMITALEDRKQYQADYRMVIEGKTQYARLTVTWGSDHVHFIIGVENVNEEVRREEEHVKALQMANDLARRDGLTGAKNITAYHEMEDALQKDMDAKAEDLVFAICICDINYLKHVNDTYGHKAGDEYIRSACKMIFEIFSHSPVFRVGGDEFAVIMRGSDYENRNRLLKKIRTKALENQRNNSGPVVASGIAVFDKKADHKVSEVFERADGIMYENKNHLKKLKAAEGE
ncbi:MAG: diguanylate cyclase [Acetatifactor sp.]|nr:diguanylate cyclase [Acetatifactor sp.]